MKIQAREVHYFTVYCAEFGCEESTSSCATKRDAINQAKAQGFNDEGYCPNHQTKPKKGKKK